MDIEGIHQMNAVATGMRVGWFSQKIILAYGLGSLLFLTSAGLLKFLPARTLGDVIFSLSPRPEGRGTEDLDRQKTREAVAKLSPILAKFGLAFLGVALLARGVRSVEFASKDHDPEGIATDDPDGPTHRGRFRALDWAVPTLLAILVLGQIAPMMKRPLIGDELVNYEQHLRIPFTGMLTTMGGANNQLGYSVLAWVSLRVFGDSPFSVRLPALLGAMLLPAVAYRFSLKELGRPGATMLGLLLAIWPDTIMAGIQGRSYSLLMMISIIHLYYFKKFATRPDRSTAWPFAASLAVAYTLHMWFVIVAGAELVFLALLKLADRLGWEPIGLRTPLRIETFLLFLTLGGLGGSIVQAGILPKFFFILTQKNVVTIDARLVLHCMNECVQGLSLTTESVPLDYRFAWGTQALRVGVDVVALVGLLACVRVAWIDSGARFVIVFAGVVALSFFAFAYIQKPVYLYARFFLVLPMILAWAAARGWSFLLDPTMARSQANVSSWLNFRVARSVDFGEAP